MNCNYLIIVLLSIGSAVSEPAVNYTKVAEEIFANFSVGPVYVGDFKLDDVRFTVEGQEYELNIKDAVIRKFEPIQVRYDALIRKYRPVRVVPNGHPLETPGQHSMEIHLTIEPLIMDSKLLYKKMGSSEPFKELNLVSTGVDDFKLNIILVINFDVNKRKVLSIDEVGLGFLPQDETDFNCDDLTPKFCDALSMYFWYPGINAAEIPQNLKLQIKKQLTGRQY